jgi:hypothetical protein
MDRDPGTRELGTEVTQFKVAAVCDIQSSEGGQSTDCFSDTCNEDAILQRLLAIDELVVLCINLAQGSYVSILSGVREIGSLRVRSWALSNFRRRRTRDEPRYAHVVTPPPLPRHSQFLFSLKGFTQTFFSFPFL